MLAWQAYEPSRLSFSLFVKLTYENNQGVFLSVNYVSHSHALEPNYIVKISDRMSSSTSTHFMVKYCAQIQKLFKEVQGWEAAA